MIGMDLVDKILNNIFSARLQGSWTIDGCFCKKESLTLKSLKIHAFSHIKFFLNYFIHEEVIILRIDVSN